MMEDKVMEIDEREICIDLVRKSLQDIKGRYGGKMFALDGGASNLSMAHWQILHLDSLGFKSYKTTIKDQLYKHCLEIAKQNGIKLGLHMKSQLRAICNDYKLVLSIHKSLKK